MGMIAGRLEKSCYNSFPSERKHGVQTPLNMKTLEQLMASPRDFPLEITLSSGDKHLLPHPDHLQRHPHLGDFVIYPDVGPFSLVINASQIVSLRPVRKRPPLRKAS